jgi:hypothetical protein
MASANDGTLLPYTALNMLEEACSRAGIAPEQITGEIVFKALDQLNLVLTSLLNRGFQLWEKQQVILPCYQGVNQIPLPPGTNLVTTLNRRSVMRVLGTPFSDTGGVAGSAFDDNFGTFCTQTAPNGAIGSSFTTPTVVTQIGLLSGAPGSWAVFFEWSNDNINWTSVSSAQVTFDAADEWEWFDLQGSPVAGALYWRVRSAGATPFALAELFFGNNPSEIYLGAWNIDDYSNMPNKFQGGQVVNYYQQRNISASLLYVWPTPDATARYDTLVVWVTQYLDQVSSISQALPVPQRWYDAITACMARRLCRSLKEADIKRYDMLVAEEKEAMWLAESEERDTAPTNYDLGLRYYTA